MLIWPSLVSRLFILYIYYLIERIHIFGCFFFSDSSFSQVHLKIKQDASYVLNINDHANKLNRVKQMKSLAYLVATDCNIYFVIFLAALWTIRNCWREQGYWSFLLEFNSLFLLFAYIALKESKTIETFTYMDIVRVHIKWEEYMIMRVREVDHNYWIIHVWSKLEFKVMWPLSNFWSQ